MSPALPTLVAAATMALACAGCSQNQVAAIYPTADLRPPFLLEAGPEDPRRVVLRFDEAVKPVEGSFASEPQAELSCLAQDRDLVVAFASDQSPGADYALVGEVDDRCGNRTRFLLEFAGWNDRAPPLRISEAQCGKNASKTRPHRDFIELVALADGNIGGEELSWASSVKSASYRLPAVELRKGDYVVVHLAPEGIPEEVDELGADLSASGGADSSPTGRDLWCSALPLPDESGAIALSLRPGTAPIDGLFYAADDKSGALSAGRLATLVSALASAGSWPLAGATPAWEDAFRWKSSPAKSICRSGTASGPEAWYATEAGGQSPGLPNLPAGTAKTQVTKTSKPAQREAQAKKPRPTRRP